MINGRLLLMGSILIVLGFVLFVSRDVEVTLILPIIGVVLLVVGVIYKPRKNKIENITLHTT
jgi:membrane-bound ClpP family serine protease